MNFVWDEAKRDRVFASRGIDFSDFVPEFFDGRALLSVPTPRHGEDRYLSRRPAWQGVRGCMDAARRADPHHHRKEGKT